MYSMVRRKAAVVWVHWQLNNRDPRAVRCVNTKWEYRSIWRTFNGYKGPTRCPWCVKAYVVQPEFSNWYQGNQRQMLIAYRPRSMAICPMHYKATRSPLLLLLLQAKERTYMSIELIMTKSLKCVASKKPASSPIARPFLLQLFVLAKALWLKGFYQQVAE